MSLRAKTHLLFLAFVLLPLIAVGVVSSIGTRIAVERVASTGAVSAAEQAPTAASSTNPADGVVPSVPPRREVTDRQGRAAATVDQILAPLNRVWLAYAALILLVGAAATLGYRIVSERVFRALEEFRQAVERITEGDFAPWLPPPGTDEVGWLSLALGRMAERMGQMMQSVEQSGRLAVVGEMAAHVAHEVRTPLSSIKLNLQLLQRSADKGLVSPDARVSIDTSLREIARLENTVTRVLEFGAPEPAARERCSLHELVTEAAELVRGTMEQAGVDLRLDLAAESEWIFADAGRVKGVFLNLLMNSLDEMPDGGVSSIETQLFLGDGGQQMLAVAVSDSGSGVPTHLQSEIFHPFFTTKADGCGMGLPAALRTLREHGGDLYLSERLDGRPGACFVATFPVAPPALTGSPPVRPNRGEAPVASPGAAWRPPSRNVLRWTRVSRAVSESGDAHDPSAEGRSLQPPPPH